MLKLFLFKSLLFGLIMALYLAAVFSYNLYQIKSCPSPIPKDLNILILGDSHVQKAVDPSYFTNAINIAQTAEPYPLSFWKLKDLVKSAEIDTLLLGFSEHNFSSFNDHKFSDFLWSETMFSRSYLIGGFDALSKKVKVDFSTLRKIYFRKMLLLPHTQHQSVYIGEFRASKGSHLNNIQATLNRHYTYNDTPVDTSSVAYSYLDSILTLCERNNIEPILIAPPVHPRYAKNIPSNITTYFEHLKHQLVTEGVVILDYGNRTLPDDHFIDGDHLNRKGAEWFSKKLQNKLYGKVE